MGLSRWVWVMAILVLGGAAFADDWPQWRGGAHNGVSGESSDYPKAWPPTRLWDRKVGKGCTSPVIADGKLYVMGWTGRADRRKNNVGTDTVYCLDARSGRELWKQAYPSRFQGRRRTGDTGAYGGPSATPEDGKYKELSRVEKIVRGTCYPGVGLSDGVIACKDRDGALVCFSIGEEVSKEKKKEKKKEH